jgi:hypothetical protein
MSHFENPFVLKASEYKRDLRVLEHYVQDSALFLSKMTGRDIAHSKAFVRTQLSPGGKFPFVDPKIQYLERGEHGDRELMDGTFLRYLKESIARKDIITPPLTMMYSPLVKKSWLSDEVVENVRIRGVAKKEKFQAEMDGDLVRMNFKELDQVNAKQSNNSLSGAHQSTSTPLYNQSSHSILTSICRSTAGYGNANNEKFLAGNRHYWSSQIVMTNIISIIGNSDYALIDAVVAKYNLVYPCVKDVMDLVKYCTKRYWRDERQMAIILRLVQSLTPSERAAFVYTGDLFRLRLLNPDMIRTFIDRLAAPAKEPATNFEEIFQGAQEDHENLACLLNPQHTKGIKRVNIKGDKRQGIPADPIKAGAVAATIRNIETTITDYADFIRAFFVTGNMPASLANFTGSARDVVLMSDTDSTIFTVQDWVKWHQGGVTFTDEANAVADVVVFLTAATVVHILARMSANLGAIEEHIFKIALKNEYKFDAFVPTNNTKHYFAIISSQEGNIFKDYKTEIKGVHLKTSTISKKVIKIAEDMMVDDILKAVIAGRTPDVPGILKKIGDIERNIYETISRGDPEFFRFARINSPDSYRGDLMRSNYGQYLFWKEVFAPKYGEIAPPPYTCYKASTELDTPTKTRAYLETIEDRALAERIEAFLRKTGRDKLTTIWVPNEVIQSKGVPKEILDAINSRKIVGDICNVFYIITDALGLTLPESVYVSDYY